MINFNLIQTSYLQIGGSSHHSVRDSASKERENLLHEQVTTVDGRKCVNCKEEHWNQTNNSSRRVVRSETLVNFISSGLFVKHNLILLTKNEFSILHAM
jgi:hypothetical protein